MIYHVKVGSQMIQLEKLEDDNESGRMIWDAIGGITIFALIVILMVLAFTF
jgi:hypothetical protein